MSETNKTAQMFKVLSVDTRVRMVELLKQRALCVNALAAQLGITPPAVSQHLRILRDADIVKADKQGYFVHYRVNETTLAQWKKLADNVLSPEGS
ncbi:ArsR/SmtB family transcription factor [Desulfobacula sp.]|uniref:ArsR/SmtB family transcription factor n=1 Tax=Desulfobacula sp. TaxID=2593537 RepID=UPI0039B8A722